MNEENAKQLIELIKAQSNVKIGQGVISGNTLSIDGVSGEIVGKCQGDNVLLRGEDGQWYGFIDSGEEETQVLSSKTIRNYKRQAPVDKDEVICFLIDVSNSIEMDGVNRCMTILNNQLEGQFKRLTNQKIIILPFADSVYTPNTIFGNTLTRQKAIVHLTAIVTGYDSLEDKFDRYDPSVFIYGSFGISESDPNKDTLLNAYKSFWINEGTDLSENGIDGIASAIALFKSKSTIYLITDNEKYSRNETSIESLNLNKIKKLYFDFCNPVNVPSEHIVVQGQEQNPYCSNSAITTVLVNDVKIGNYPTSSNILIESSSLKLIWDGGGEGKEYEIQNPLDFEYEVWIRGSQKRPRWVKNISFEGWALDGRVSHRRYYPQTDYYWRYYENERNRIVSETEGYLITLPDDFFPNANEKGLDVFEGSYYISYPDPPIGWTNNGLQPESAFDYETSNFKLCWIAIRDGEFINQYLAFILDRDSVTLSGSLKLVWDGGQRTITNPNNYKVWVSPVSTPDIVYVEVNCSYEINDGVRITTVSSWDLQLKTSVQLEFLNYFKPPDYHVTVLENTSSYYKLQSNSSGENLQLLSAYDLYKYGTLISERQYILVRPSVYINNGDIIEIWINSVRVVFPLNNNRWNVVIRDGDYLYETYPINGINGIYSRDIIPDNSSPNRKIISTSMISNELSKQLKINGNIVQSLQETDIVKVICQPQNVPLIETNSTLYTTSLPPSNKIIYL